MNFTKGMIKELLKEEAFILYGQPKWTFGKNTCNTYEVFAEMVLTADRGSIRTSEIIETIESDEELTHMFSGWFLNAALSTGEYLQNKTGNHRIVLSMNVLALQANLPNFCDKVREAISKTSLEPHQIQFELSEAQQLTNHGIENLNYVHDVLKVRLLLGNFGTGHSNLDLLKHVHFDGLELDKSFSKGIPESDMACKLVVGISQFADVLGLNICAKGIETDEQMEFFESQNFSKGQGFLIGEPMPIDDLANYIIRYAIK